MMWDVTLVNGRSPRRQRPYTVAVDVPSTPATCFTVSSRSVANNQARRVGNGVNGERVDDTVVIEDAARFARGDAVRDEHLAGGGLVHPVVERPRRPALGQADVTGGGLDVGDEGRAPLIVEEPGDGGRGRRGSRSSVKASPVDGLAVVDRAAQLALAPRRSSAPFVPLQQRRDGVVFGAGHLLGMERHPHHHGVAALALDAALRERRHVARTALSLEV
jgi:hypothetical protein